MKRIELKKAADAAVTGGIRSINGIIGNDILLTPEDIQASSVDHSHELLEKILEVILKNSGKSLIINTAGSGCDWQMIPGVPVGAIIPWAGLTPPAGYLECAGQILKREIYKDLFKAIGAVWGNTGADNFKLPDFTSAARFLRSRGVGLEMGMTQEDAIRNIEGKFTFMGNGSALFPSNTYNSSTLASSGATSLYHDINIDTSRSVPTADENRPKNAVVMYCIKAVDEYINPAQVDIGGMASQLENKPDRNEIQGLAGTRLWVSDECMPVFNTPTIVTHGLTIDPSRCKWDVLLNRMEAYNVGDYAIGWFSAAYPNLFICFPPIASLNSTTIQFNTGVQGSGSGAIKKMTGTFTDITLVKWRYIFRIWY